QHVTAIAKMLVRTMVRILSFLCGDRQRRPATWPAHELRRAVETAFSASQSPWRAFGTCCFAPNICSLLPFGNRAEGSEHLRAPRFKTLIYLKGFGVGACGAMVSTSKFLAQMNKTQDVGRATQGCSALQSLLS